MWSVMSHSMTEFRGVCSAWVDHYADFFFFVEIMSHSDVFSPEGCWYSVFLLSTNPPETINVSVCWYFLWLLISNEDTNVWVKKNLVWIYKKKCFYHFLKQLFSVALAVEAHFHQCDEKKILWVVERKSSQNNAVFICFEILTQYFDKLTHFNKLSHFEILHFLR